MFKSGQIINDTYEIKEKIGSGGGGIIYKAVHIRMRKNVAIKLIKENVIGLIRNRSEVDLLKDLKHPYLPQVFDFFECDNEVYTVMEFIEGQDFKQLISSGKTFSEKEVKEFGKQLCSAVSYLHSQTPPIIHSDIKPANIMLTDKNNICLIDFNISTISGSDNRAYSIGGSKGFAAPEQFKKIIEVPVSVDEFHEETRFLDDDETEFIGDDNENNAAETENHSVSVKTKNISMAYIDMRTDIYGMGASLYYMMTGRVPNNGETDFRGIKISNGLKHIINKAMNPNPEKRYRNAEEMLAAIQGLSKKKTAAAAAVGSVAVIAVICGAIVAVNNSGNNTDTVSTEQTTDTSTTQTEAPVTVSEVTTVTTEVTSTSEITEAVTETTKLEVTNEIRKEWIKKVGDFMSSQSPNGEYNSFLSIFGSIGLNDYTFDDIPEIIVSNHSVNGWCDNQVFDIDGNKIYGFTTGYDEEIFIYKNTETDEPVIMFKGSAGSVGSSADYQVCFNDQIAFYSNYSMGDFVNAELHTMLPYEYVETVKTTDAATDLKIKYFNKYFRSSVFVSSNAAWHLEDTGAELNDAFYAGVAEELVDKYINYLETGEPASNNYEQAVATVSETSAKTDEIQNASETEENYITINGEKYSTDLIYLDLSNCGLTDNDVIELSKMKNLKELYLDNNEITDLSFAEQLTELEYLSATNNFISDISSLEKLKNLYVLMLSENLVSDISPIGSLSNMIVLNLSNNEVRDITPIGSLTNLEILNLSNNEVSDISSLRSCYGLCFLDLTGNNISEDDITYYTEYYMSSDCEIKY